MRQMQLLAHIPDIDGFHILYLFHVGEIEIGHTDLLPFIQKRCSPQGKNERGKCLGAFIMILGIITEARNRAGLIVVFKINGIPRQSLLPLGQAGKESIWTKPAQKPFDFIAVGFHVLKGKYRGKFPTGGID